ncbi:MAG: CoA-binding protein, partial [Deltaproteobacteria bacterium]|nr:CoA-binding protein [Deltaproteobacteria bacterium]
MKTTGDLGIFFKPMSIAVIGATERQGSWGSLIMKNLLSRRYGGAIYPVNIRAQNVYDIPAFKDVREIPGTVDLAVLTIPGHGLKEVIIACGQKQVSGIIIVASGFGETSLQGLDKEKEVIKLAQSFGIRILGPNSSGAFNLHEHFIASGARSGKIKTTPIAAVSQGAFAFQDLMASGANRGMGAGKFVHTGNEGDLSATDFLDYFGRDPDVEAIVMYIESVRDSRRFIDVARRVTRKKPVVVYKGGRTPGSARAAHSHTAALAGKNEIYHGLFQQVGVIMSPTMELLLPLGHALIERPPMGGKRVGIITQ